MYIDTHITLQHGNTHSQYNGTCRHTLGPLQLYVKYKLQLGECACNTVMHLGKEQMIHSQRKDGNIDGGNADSLRDQSGTMQVTNTHIQSPI